MTPRWQRKPIQSSTRYKRGIGIKRRNRNSVILLFRRWKLPCEQCDQRKQKGVNWGAGGGWNDDTANTYPDWVQVSFNGSKTINEIDVFTLQDNYASPSEPTEAMTFSQYGIVDFKVQYWDGVGWTAVPGGVVTGNNKVWRKFTFSSLTTDKIRVRATNALNSYSRVTEIEAYQVVTPAYDAAGNVTNDGAHTYEYDSENRIVSVDGGSTASYAYDHQNRRYKKTIGSTVTHYVWQGSHVLAEHNGSTGTVLIDYVYSGSRMIAKVASGSIQYFLSDRLSVRLSLDSSGNVLGRQSHLPFGEDFGESGTQEKHHFTSYESDSESGTDYAVNRQYSQVVGRFMRPDPVFGPSSDPRKANRYLYVENRPVGLVDPLGLDPVTICFWNEVEIDGPDYLDYDFEGCDTYDLPTRPERSPNEPPPSCDVQLPDDADLRAAVSLVLGEATPYGYLGRNEYAIDQAGLVKKIGDPKGPAINETTLGAEAWAMVSVLQNRLANGMGSSWAAIASSGAFVGYNKGKRIVDSGNYGLEGSPICQQIKLALNAVILVSDGKLLDPRILYWKAVVQQGSRGPFVREWEEGDLFRLGYNDFSTHN